MNDLFIQIKQQLKEWHHWDKSKRILLAISGGVDSMVLLDLMMKVNEQLPSESKKEFVVAHFDHRLREHSHDEAELVKEYAKQHHLLYFIEEWDQPAQKNVEASARDARYQFFADVMDATDGDTLITAHHLNDLGETVLMRLIRGTSLRGIRGIQSNYQRLITTSSKRSKSIRVLRPLISIMKEDIYDYAKEHNIPYIEDHTNSDRMYMRNRIRHDIVPYFEEENPQFLANLMSLSKQLEASYDAHYSQYLRAEPELLMQLSEGRWLLYVPKFLELSSNLIQIYLAIFLEERLIHQIESYNKAAVTQIEKLITQTNAPNMTINIANHWVAVREYDYIWIQPQVMVPKTTNQVNIQFERVNHWYKLSKTEAIGIFEVGGIGSDLRKDTFIDVPIELKDTDSLPLVRHRMDGDTLSLRRPDGTLYHKKVSRILIDQKVPKSQREEFWIVEGSEGVILGMFPHIGRDENYYNETEHPTHRLIYQKNKTKS